MYIILIKKNNFLPKGEIDELMEDMIQTIENYKCKKRRKTKNDY
jgi:hypothetical protein